MERADGPFCRRFIVSSLARRRGIGADRCGEAQFRLLARRRQILPGPNEPWRHGCAHVFEGAPREAEQKVREDLGGARPLNQQRPGLADVESGCETPAYGARFASARVLNILLRHSKRCGRWINA